MDERAFLNVMHLAERLKMETRHSWMSDGRRESVAEHCWRMALMAYFIKDEFPQADEKKLVLMALIHDLGEIFTGDIPAFHKTDSDRDEERLRLAGWVDTLPAPYRAEMKVLYDEMEAMQTLEARLCKALDKLEVLIQHNEAGLSTWLPLERDMNLTYADEYVAFSDALKRLRREILCDTLDKLAHGDSACSDGAEARENEK